MKTKGLWKGKKVLVIGHTSFIGSWLCIWLLELGAKVIGYGLDDCKEEDNYVLCKLSDKVKEITGDVRNKESLKKVFEEEKPEIVINLLSLDVCNNQENIYEIILDGTINILKCIQESDIAKVGIMVGSDKCYEVKDQIWGYREDDYVGGDTPYNASIACAEMIINSFRNTYLNADKYDEHGKTIANVRVGSVIGGGDWREDSIIATCAKAFINKEPAIIKCTNAVLSLQHVLEPIRGILMLIEKLYDDPINYSESWNFGSEYDNCLPTLDAVEKFKKQFRKCEILELDDAAHNKDNSVKVLDITKAKYKLGWKPKWTIDKAITYTAEWYKNYKTKDVYTMCRNQIDKYMLI